MPSLETLLFVTSALSFPTRHTDPGTLPQHEQRIKASRVIRTNYSLLWQHLDASNVLPKLMEKSIISESQKKEVKSYQQSHGQSAVIIDALFCRAHMQEALVTICDTLQTIPGKEPLGQHILRGTVHSAFWWVQSNIYLNTLYDTMNNISQAAQVGSIAVCDCVVPCSHHPVFDYMYVVCRTGERPGRFYHLFIT